MTPESPSPESRIPLLRGARIRIGTWRFSAVELLASLVLLFVSAPFVEDLPRGDLIEAGLLTVVMVSAVMAVGGRRQTLIVALFLVVPAIAAKWLHRLYPGLMPPPVYLVAAVTFFGYVVVQLLRFILRASHVDTNVLCAGIAGYLMLGLVWMPAYALVARLNPTAFAFTPSPNATTTMDGFNSFYFSFITLCTVGYGDVTPVSRVARMLAVTEAIVGVFYVAVLISRLVAIHSSNQVVTKTNPPEQP